MKHIKLTYSILIALFASITCMADNYVIINQVMYDTPLNEVPSISPASNGEFIELYNAGTSTVSLAGWHLMGDKQSEIWTFSNSVSIPSENYLIIACRRGTNNNFQLSQLYTLPNNTNYSILYQNKILLANTGETITLCNADNDTIDQMYYDGTSHMSVPNSLHANNEGVSNGDSCVSLHRTSVEFDADGKVIKGTSEWTTALVSFGSSMLPYSTFQETYITGGQTLPTGENYILSIQPLDPISRIDINDGQPSISSNARTRSDLRYLDGLGRLEESIALSNTPGKNDLVRVMDYYGMQKEARSWLPIVMETEGQRIDKEEVQDQAQIDFTNSCPYSEIIYENSAQKRPVTQFRPGRSCENKGIEQTYNFNTSSDQVRIFSVNTDNALCTDGSYYGAATLFKNTVADEDGKVVLTYTDKQGRKIMEERDTSRTYYVYDEIGHLRYVLPNLPSSKLNNGTYGIDNPTLKAIAYCYRYDDRGNVIYKRIPGCEPQYLVYDVMGHLILKQEGNQRPNNHWTMYVYDSNGRIVYTAHKPISISHSGLINMFKDRWQVEDYGNNQSCPNTDAGYASCWLGTVNLKLLTVNYYDDYDFLQSLPDTDRQALTFSQEAGYGKLYESAKGLLTGTRTYNLSEAGFTVTAYYYDAQGRAIQTRSTRNAGGYKVTNTAYLFDGSVAQQLTTQGTDEDFVQEHYSYAYDHMGRIKEVSYQLNNEPEIILSKFSYDSIGRLAQKLLHNNRDTIQYSYDIRSMLTETNNRHFSERLFYSENLPQSASPCYNGNLSASRISCADSIFTFAYSYDAQNRLKTSSRIKNNQSTVSESFTYDEAGNVISLKRFLHNRKIDDLSYDYGDEGNQLIAVSDNGQNADRYDVVEYHNGDIQADTTMRYDANGNLIYDADRGISVIRYNVLNLPDTIQFINGNQIVNLYDAVGHKYKSIYYTVIPTVITSHYGIMHYTFDTDTVEYLVTEYADNMETGYTRTDTIFQRIHNSIGYRDGIADYHYIKDHLGNICAVVHSTADTIVQRTIYYASGIPMAQSFGRDKQPYLYNGKEFVEAHGLNAYDYGFRQYYATIGRFTSTDPLSEQTPWQSPYSYAGNKFVNAIDYMGLFGISSFADGRVCQYIVVDIEGYLLGGEEDGDESIYIDIDGKWSPEDGKDGLIYAGLMKESFHWYMSRGGGGGIGARILDSRQVLNAIVCAAMNGRLSISISVSLGLEAGDKFFSIGETNYGLYGNLMSFELGSITLTNSMDDPITEFSYLGKNNIIKVTQGFQLIVPTYEKSFNIYASDLEYVPRSLSNKFSLTWVPSLSSSGDLSWNFSFGMFLSVSIEIIYANKNE